MGIEMEGIESYWRDWRVCRSQHLYGRFSAQLEYPFNRVRTIAEQSTNSQSAFDIPRLSIESALIIGSMQLVKSPRLPEISRLQIYPSPSFSILQLCRLFGYGGRLRAKIFLRGHPNRPCYHCYFNQIEPRRLNCSRADMPLSKDRGC